jgi:hypothetical protein
MRLYCPFKVTVLLDLRGVTNRLKRSFLINCETASIYFFILKGHHHEVRKTGFSILTTFTLKLTGCYHFILQKMSP